MIWLHKFFCGRAMVVGDMFGVLWSKSCSYDCSTLIVTGKTMDAAQVLIMWPQWPKWWLQAWFHSNCDEGESNNGGDMFDFVQLTDIGWPGNDYLNIDPSNEQICKNSCLEDCLCVVAINTDNKLWKSNIRYKWY